MYVKIKEEITQNVKVEEYVMYFDKNCTEKMWNDTKITKENNDYIEYRDGILNSAKIGNTEFKTLDGEFKKQGRGRVSKTVEIEMNNFREWIRENL
jgi:hypothetical protein